MVGIALRRTHNPSVLGSNFGEPEDNRSTQTVGGSLGFFKKLLPEVVSSLDNALQGASTSVQVPEL